MFQQAAQGEEITNQVVESQMIPRASVADLNPIQDPRQGHADDEQMGSSSSQCQKLQTSQGESPSLCQCGDSARYVRFQSNSSVIMDNNLAVSQTQEQPAFQEVTAAVATIGTSDRRVESQQLASDDDDISDPQENDLEQQEDPSEDQEAQLPIVSLAMLEGQIPCTEHKQICQGLAVPDGCQLPPRLSQEGGNRRSVLFHPIQRIDTISYASACPPQAPHQTSGCQTSEEGEKRAQLIQVFAGLGTTEPKGIKGKSWGRSLRMINLFVRPLGHKEIPPQRITVLLDNGSNRTLMDEQTYRAFGLPIELNLDLIGSVHGQKFASCGSMELEISADSKEWFPVREAMTMKNFRFKGPRIAWDEFCAREPAFKDVKVEAVSYEDIRMLLGGEAERWFCPKDGAKRIEEKGVFAYESRLGWTIAGEVPLDFGIQVNATLSVPEFTPKAYFDLLRSVHEELKRYNDLDVVPQCRTKHKELSRQEIRDQEEIDRTTTTHEGFVRTGMLWKDPRPSVPQSYNMAISRLNSLEKVLAEKGEEVYQKYRQTIMDDLEKGYIIELNAQEVKALRSKEHWFLPHFVVFHPDKPNRPRRVLDCAAKVGDTSLNTLLRTGPNNLPWTNGVQYRCRGGRYMLVGDVGEMFMQVRVLPEDQCMLMMMWRERGQKEPRVFCYTRHVFGAKESPAIATNALRVAIATTRPDLLPLVEKNIYMDDLQISCDTSEEVAELGMGVCKALEVLGFKMAKWASNDKAVLSHFPTEDLAPPFREVMQERTSPLPTAKALGMRWDTETDTYRYSYRLQNKQAKTAAEVLSQLASVYDALQVVGPYIMAGKLFLQALQMADGFNWALQLTPVQQAWWDDWYRGLERIAGLTIPRWYGWLRKEPVVAHVFADASEAGYGAVLYLASFHQQRTAFVQARSRVANKRKLQTIPRLELQGLLLAARMGEQFLYEVEGGYSNVIRLFLWTDSSTVWHWVQNEARRYREFVRNRLDEIKDMLKDHAHFQPEVRWVGTKSNPADLISRGTDDADHMCTSWPFWTGGPPFIIDPIESWPESPKPPATEDPSELAKIYALATFGSSSEFPFQTLEEFQQRGGYGTLQEAEQELAVLAQRETLTETDQKRLRQLQRQGEEEDPPCYMSHEFREGRLRGLRCFMDEDGLIRVATRLQGASFLSFDEKNPVLLPSKCAASRMLVRGYHHRAGHAGAKTVAAMMSKKFYVASSFVKQVVRNCASCRTANPLPMKIPMANLHEDRVSWGSVFKNTAMDFFGPFYLAGGAKGYGLLFTCLATRAMHIEATSKISVPEWGRALERFIARRGAPRTITCDRASTFLSGAKQVSRVVLKELTDEFGSELAKQLREKHDIAFRFTPVGSPHFNGAAERLIREVKGYLLRAGASVSHFSRSAFTTFLARAEGVLNQRPLAVDDDGRVITPASILAPATSMGFGFPWSTCLSHVIGQQKQAIDYFWRHWSDSYLKRLSLAVASGSRGTAIQEGDQVLMHWEKPGNKFKGIGQLQPVKVLKIMPGPDGLARRFIVQGPDGGSKEVAWSRLYMGEIEALGRRPVNIRVKGRRGQEGAPDKQLAPGEC